MRFAPFTRRRGWARVASAPRALLALAMALVLAAACGGRPAPASAPPGTVSERCPDLSRPDELAAFDFAGAYALSPEAADKLKAATLAAIEIGALAERLDADFGMACARIAHDLGEQGDWRSGDEACAAAIKIVQGARESLGPKLETQLVVSPPVCLVDEALVTKCASLCDSSAPAEKIGAECEARAGRCDGECDGSCAPNGAMQCAGVCAGACEGAMRGACGGRCVGTCDGKRSKGACLGTCIGTCDGGAMVGTCEGSCAGPCELSRPGICAGLCAGACSVELADPKCAGGFKPADVSTDCRARCDLAVLNATECAPPVVGLVVTGAKAREGEALRSALDKSLPGLIQILYEAGDKGAARVMNAQAVIESARAGFEAMARSGSAATASRSKAQLTRCFDELFKRAVAQAAATKKGLDEASAIRDAAAGGKIVSARE